MAKLEKDIKATNDEDSDSVTTKQNSSKVRKVTLNFLRSTTIQCLPNALNAPSRCLKTLWILLFIVMFGALIAHTAIVVKRFFRYPTTVSMRIHHSRRAEFPAVTICNQNPIERSRLNNAEWGRIADLDRTVNCLAVDSLSKKPHLQSESLRERYQNATERCMKSEVHQRKRRQIPTSPPSWTSPSYNSPQAFSANTGSSENTSSPTSESWNTANTSDAHETTMQPDTDTGPHTPDSPTEEAHYMTQPTNARSTATSTVATKTTLPPIPQTTTTTTTTTYFIPLQSTTPPYYFENSFNNEEEQIATQAEAEFEKNNIAATEGFAGLAKYTDKLDLLLNSENSDLTDVTNILTPNYADLFDATNYTAQTQLTHLVRECSFDRQECNIRVFDPDSADPGEIINAPFRSYMTGKYGRCFSFGSTGDIVHKSARANGQITSRSGSDYGLRLTININASEYIGMFAQQYGIRVLIHKPQVIPVLFKSFNVPVGALTAIGIRRRVTIRLPKPYESNCWDEIPKDFAMKNDWVDNKLPRINASYTYQFCQSTCLNTRIYENCSCVKELSYYEDSNWTWLPEVCDVFNSTQRECMVNVSANIYVFEGYCDCQQACEEYRYERSLSSVPWPTWEYTNLILNNFAANRPVWDDFNADDDWVNLGQRDCLKSLIDKWHTEQKSNSTEEHDSDDKSTENNGESDKNDQECNSISKSLLRLHVYYEELNFDVVEESPEYSMDALGSDFGGIIGLYLGLSIAAIFEVVQYFALLTGIIK